MASKSDNETSSPRRYDFGELPETPPAHIWALKALRNQFLGTRQSASPTPPPASSISLDDDEMDEIGIPAVQGSPASPSKAGILKTPGTISRRKSVTFNPKSNPQQNKQQTPKDAKPYYKSIPGKWPSPYTPRTSHVTPANNDGDTDLIPVSRSAMETLTAHINLVLENNNRLQQFISAGQAASQTYSKYDAHPDLQGMKNELEREKEVLKGLFADFEQQQLDMAKRERELNAQYTALSSQMEEQYILQNSTAKMVDDFQKMIQGLNRTITEQKEGYEKDIGDLRSANEHYEERIHFLTRELDDTKDLLRESRRELEAKDLMINEGQEKVKSTQRQLSQLRMEMLESRVGANVQNTGEMSSRITHRRTNSRRTVSATYVPRTTSEMETKSSVPLGNGDKVPLISLESTDDEYKKIAVAANKVLSPRNINIRAEEPVVPQTKVPGQDAIARRAAAAKRLEERQRNRERLGKENM